MFYGCMLLLWWWWLCLKFNNKTPYVYCMQKQHCMYCTVLGTGTIDHSHFATVYVCKVTCQVQMAGVLTAVGRDSQNLSAVVIDDFDASRGLHAHGGCLWILSTSKE